MDRFIDFDAFMEERSGGKFQIKAFGEVHEIPNDVPFDVILKISRAYKNNQSQMSDDDTIGMANTIFGEETFNKWLKKGITLKGVMLLTEKVMAIYMENATADQGDKSNTP